MRARVFGGINFGDLVKNSPIRQIKIPEKVSGYTVWLPNLLLHKFATQYLYDFLISYYT